MRLADRKQALATADRFEQLAQQGGPGSEDLKEAARLIRELGGALKRSQAKVRINLDVVTAGLKAAWLELGSELPEVEEDKIEALAKGLFVQLTAPVSKGVVLKLNQIAYLKDLAIAGSYGLERGQTHPIMSKLADQGLAQFERRRWRITQLGLNWLAENVPDFQLPTS